MTQLFRVELTATIYIKANSKNAAISAVESIDSEELVDVIEAAKSEVEEMTLRSYPPFEDDSLYDNSGEFCDESPRDYFAK